MVTIGDNNLIFRFSILNTSQSNVLLSKRVVVFT